MTTTAQRSLSLVETIGMFIEAPLLAIVLLAAFAAGTHSLNSSNTRPVPHTSPAPVITAPAITPAP